MRVISESVITTNTIDEYLSTVIDSEVTNDRVLLPDSSRRYDSGYISEIAINDYLQCTEYEQQELYFWIRNPVGNGTNLSEMVISNSATSYDFIEPTGYALVRPEIYVDMLLYDAYSELLESSAD